MISQRWQFVKSGFECLLVLAIAIVDDVEISENYKNA